MANTEIRHGRAGFVHDTVGNLLTVRIRGEIDHHTAVSVRRDIDALLYERRPTRLMLDLSAVGFMDSSGLGLIMGRLSLLREWGGELTIWNPSPEVCGILALAGMERMVRIEYPADAANAANAAEGVAVEAVPAATSETPIPTPRRRRGQAPRRGSTRKEKDA